MAKFYLNLIHNRFVVKGLRVCSTACLLGLVCFVANANAQIVVDFTHDNGFISNNPEATAALQAAVDDINAVLNLNLGAVTDMTTGTSGNANNPTTTTFDFEYQYTNPTTDAPETILNTAFAANEFRLFVGSQNLTNALGEGGPGVGTISPGTSSAIIGSGSLQDAIDDAEANDNHGRGEGPVINQASGSFDSGETFAFDIGPAVGNLRFDELTDWQFDHTIDVEAGKSDFFTVALHETIHAIGFGTSDSWNELVSGSDWLGEEVIAANGGSGEGIIFTGDQAHFAEGLMSARISDGMLQETVMDPTITVGTRKTLTRLDIAALRDFGFVNARAAAVPEPTSILVLASIGLMTTSRRRRVA